MGTPTFAWTQTGTGPTVMLDDASSATPAFIAPSVGSQTDLTFSLTVHEGTWSSDADTVTVTVLPSRVESATVDGAELSVTFDTALDTSSRPASSAFTVTASKSGASRTIAGTGALVGISNKTVTATLSAPVAADERLTVRYDKPASGNVLKDSSNTALPSFADREAGNAKDNTAPRVVSATVNGATLTITFDEALDEDSVPVPGAFAIPVVGSTPRTVVSGGVDIAGRDVTLTLDSAVPPNSTVGVTYTKQAADPLQDAAGNDVADINQTVTNVTLQVDTTPPTVSSATVNGATLTITFDEALDEDSVPVPGAFAIPVVGSTPRTVVSGGVDIAGRDVTLTLDSAVPPNSTVGVTYTKQAADPLQDAAGNDVADINQTVTNVSPPSFSSASVDGDALTVTFNGPLDEGAVPAASAFTVKATRSGTERDVDLAATNPVSISGSTVTLALAEAVLSLDTVTVAYAAPATGDKLRDADNASRLVPDFSAQTATNDTPADTAPPRVVSAAMNGATLTVVFDEALDESVTNVFAFQASVHGETALTVAPGASISGSTVTATLNKTARHGQLVLVWYVRSTNAAHQLKDLSGNKVPHAVLSGTEVPNVTPPAYSSASVNGDELTVTFNGPLDESAVPAASAFTVKATRSGTERNVDLADTNPVSVSGSAVTLTLAEAVRDSDTVTVAYAAPATGAKLQDSDNANLPVTGFGDTKTATNATPADTTPPTFVSASMNGTTLTVVFNETLAAAGASGNLSNNTFRVTHGASAHDSTSVSISGATATATFAAADAPGHGESVTALTYFQSNTAADRLADQSGNAIAVIDGTDTAVLAGTVPNVTPPSFSSATVDGDALTVTFNGPLDEGAVPAASAFTVKATRSGTERDVDLAATNPISINGSEVTLTLAEAVLRVDTVTVAYAAPATGDKLRDADNARSPGTGLFRPDGDQRHAGRHRAAAGRVGGDERGDADGGFRRGAGRERDECLCVPGVCPR